MRTVLRLGTAMAITVLVAGLAANCALPPYNANGSGSSSGGLGGSGGAAVAASSTGSSSGKTSSTTSSGSGDMSSTSSGSTSSSGGDGGMCADWTHCSPGSDLNMHCGCPGQLCSDAQCDNNGMILWCAIQGPMPGTWQPLPAPATLTCCPGTGPCNGEMGKFCVVTIDPQNSTKKGQCVDNPCDGGAVNCSCASAVCPPPQQCSPAPLPNTILCK